MVEHHEERECLKHSYPMTTNMYPADPIQIEMLKVLTTMLYLYIPTVQSSACKPNCHSTFKYTLYWWEVSNQAPSKQYLSFVILIALPCRCHICANSFLAFNNLLLLIFCCDFYLRNFDLNNILCIIRTLSCAVRISFKFKVEAFWEIFV